MNRSALAILLSAASSAVAQIPAFPGADGAAAFVTGGRGGTVYHVTSLDTSFNDTSPGTLRYGLNNANFPAGGPRTIVFDVAGRINLGRVVSGWDPNGNGWDTQSRIDIPSNVTIAGQTAPGPGITIMGGVVKPGGTNMVLRNLTIAPGYGTRGWLQPGDTSPRRPYPDQYVYDALDITGTNLMVDHVTTVYATDETISMNELANNVTIQYSNISQGQNYPQQDAEGGSYTGHALGSLIQPGSNAKISVHHNLYAHLKGRLPRVGSEVGTGSHNDFRNNVFYNWLSTAGGGASGQPSFNKFVNNFYLAGAGGDDPVGGASTDITNRAGGTGIFNGSNSTGTRVYQSGNLKDTNKDGDPNDGAAVLPTDFGSSLFVLDSSFSVPYIGVTDTAPAAYDRVLNYVGANWWMRDATIDNIDERIINEVRTGTGKIMAWADDPYNSDPNEGVEWRAMKDQTTVFRPANWDQELNNGYGQGDGMPTYWEVAHGLNPLVRDDAGDFDADGYTNLEEYLNEVAAWPAPTPLVFNGTTNSRFEQTTNWSYQWQPSRYDEAQINAGSVTINSVGQHARLLKVSATLTINAGWIDVAEQVQVHGSGQIIVNGGQLLTPSIQLTNSAQLKLSPGMNKTLKTGVVSIADSAKLDVGDNKLVLTGMSIQAVTALIATGRGDGTWNGTGIVTSMPDATTGILTTLAPSRAEDVGHSTFGGVPVSPDDILVMYTWGGDADLDGDLDGDDYFQIDSHVAMSGSVFGYHFGDFDYDNDIDGDDYFLIDSNITFAQTQPDVPTSGRPASAGLQPIPEPAALLPACAALLTFRRRRPKPAHAATVAGC